MKRQQHPSAQQHKLTWLAKTRTSSLKDSEEHTSLPGLFESLGVHVDSSHFSNTRAKSGNSGCLKRFQILASPNSPFIIIIIIIITIIIIFITIIITTHYHRRHYHYHRNHHLPTRTPNLCPSSFDWNLWQPCRLMMNIGFHGNGCGSLEMFVVGSGCWGVCRWSRIQGGNRTWAEEGHSPCWTSAAVLSRTATDELIKSNQSN